MKSGQDVSDINVLTNIAGPQATELVAQGSAVLTSWTAQAVAEGAFGVPAFVARPGPSNTMPPARISTDELFWGADRVFMVERALGVDAHPPRLHAGPAAPLAKPPIVRFYYDFSSPYAYLASTQIERVVREAQPNAMVGPRK